MTTETDKSIRLEVTLYADGKPLDVAGLIAVPEDRLKCFEELALELKKVSPRIDAWIAGHPDNFHLSDQVCMGLPKVMEKLNALLGCWNPQASHEGRINQ